MSNPAKEEFDCFSPEERKRLVKKYLIKPVEHVRLLSGQIKMSCTGRRLEDSYYLFTYRNRNNINETGTFYCGSWASKDFLSLINHPELSLFDPLRHEQSNNSSGAINPTNDAPDWHPVAIQLYNALRLLIVCGNTKPKAVIVDIKEKLLKNINHHPTHKIKSLNTIIKRDSRTLREMMNELAVTNNFRNFDFTLLNEWLTENDIESRFD